MLVTKNLITRNCKQAEMRLKKNMFVSVYSKKLAAAKENRASLIGELCED